MNQARRLTPTVHVHKPPWAPWAWTYRLDGKECDVYLLTRQAALLEAQQEANRIGLQRRQKAAMDRQAAEKSAPELREAQGRHYPSGPVAVMVAAGDEPRHGLPPTEDVGDGLQVGAVPLADWFGIGPDDEGQ